MDKQELFNNILYELTNEACGKTIVELKGLYERLVNDGLNNSGFAVESTFRIIEKNITLYLEELTKHIDECVKDYEILLTDDETDLLFADITSRTDSLLESLMRERQVYMDANRLSEGRIDYKTFMKQNYSHKLDTEKKNLKIKISLIAQKQGRTIININGNNDQVNISNGQSTINAINNPKI